MKRRFCQITKDEDLDEVEADLLAWGYPRPLGEHEREQSTFVGYGEDVLFWFNLHDETGLNFHVCMDPKSRGKISYRRFIIGVEIIAELLGADHLQATLTSEMTELRNYCARLGWRENGDGYIQPL